MLKILNFNYLHNVYYVNTIFMYVFKLFIDIYFRKYHKVLFIFLLYTYIKIALYFAIRLIFIIKFKVKICVICLNNGFVRFIYFAFIYFALHAQCVYFL